MMTKVKRSALFLLLASTVLVAGLTVATQVLSNTRQADEATFSAANALVDAGHYAEAAQMYDQLIAQGAADASLYYNLGNAYFLQGAADRAVGAYERAAQLAPRDPDIRHNLALAQGQAPGAASRQPDGPLGALAAFTSRWLTVDELASIALGAWLLFSLLIAAYRRRQSDQRRGGLGLAAAVVLVAVVLTGTALLSRVNTHSAAPTAPSAAQMAAALK